VDKERFDELNEKLESMNDDEIKEVANIIKKTYAYEFVLNLKSEFREALELSEDEERMEKAYEWQEWIDGIRDRQRLGW
jgi:hypothetical protein